jgi:hypothetical protein
MKKRMAGRWTRFSGVNFTWTGRLPVKAANQSRKARTMKTGSMLAILLFTLVAIAHVLRLVNGTDVTVGGWDVPQWVSVAGTIVPAAIAVLLWRERR